MPLLEIHQVSHLNQHPVTVREPPHQCLQGVPGPSQRAGKQGYTPSETASWVLLDSTGGRSQVRLAGQVA